jgi:hypothetical protein
MTITIRNVQIARDAWNDDADPRVRAWEEMASCRIHREPVMKAVSTRVRHCRSRSLLRSTRRGCVVTRSLWERA